MVKKTEEVRQMLRKRIGLFNYQDQRIGLNSAQYIKAKALGLTHLVMIIFLNNFSINKIYKN